MAGFLFKLETTDGTPAEPPTLSIDVPTGELATRSRLGDVESCAL